MICASAAPPRRRDAQSERAALVHRSAVDLRAFGLLDGHAPHPSASTVDCGRAAETSPSTGMRFPGRTRDDITAFQCSDRHLVPVSPRENPGRLRLSRMSSPARASGEGALRTALERLPRSTNEGRRCGFRK